MNYLILIERFYKNKPTFAENINMTFSIQRRKYFSTFSCSLSLMIGVTQFAKKLSRMNKNMYVLPASKCIWRSKNIAFTFAFNLTQHTTL